MQKEIFQRLAKIDFLIRARGTGKPAQLAAKMGMSERSIYDYLHLMKELGAPIKFCPLRETYYYDEEGIFAISFFPKNKVNIDISAEL